MIDLPVKRTPKITLASALKHENNDFFGYCLACHRNRLFLREDIIAMKLPAEMRIDQLEERFRCTQCGVCAITFQLSQRNVPGVQRRSRSGG